MYFTVPPKWYFYCVQNDENGKKIYDNRYELCNFDINAAY